MLGSGLSATVLPFGTSSACVSLDMCVVETSGCYRVHPIMLGIPSSWLACMQAGSVLLQHDSIPSRIQCAPKSGLSCCMPYRSRQSQLLRAPAFCSSCSVHVAPSCSVLMTNWWHRIEFLISHHQQHAPQSCCLGNLETAGATARFKPAASGASGSTLCFDDYTICHRSKSRHLAQSNVK